MRKTDLIQMLAGFIAGSLGVLLIKLVIVVFGSKS